LIEAVHPVSHQLSLCKLLPKRDCATLWNIDKADNPLRRLPSLDLLEKPDVNRKAGFTPEQLERLSRLLEIKFREFNIDAKVVGALPGPVVTRFEVDPAPGVKVAKISSIAKDLARSMAMIAVRVVEVIPGKTVIGIEVPNENRQIVRLHEILVCACLPRA
jgi:S-DNA-T family DNA segregation ATPase FtsK/SpoIIIE